MLRHVISILRLSSAILAPNSQAGQITVPENLNSASIPAMTSTFVMAGNNTVLINEGPTVPLENNPFRNINISTMECDDLMAFLGRRSSPLGIGSSSPVQDVDEYLNMEAFDECSINEDIVNNFLFSEPAPSSLSPYAGGDNVSEVENTNHNTGSAGIQVVGSISGEASSAIGFSANSSSLSSQAGAAEIDILGVRK